MRKSSDAWDAYRCAYQDRYGVEPLRNQKTNAILCKLVDASGSTLAPALAAFYVTHNKSFYVQQRHPVEFLLKDVQSIHTDMMLGEQMTNQKARQADKTQSSANVWNNLLKSEQAGGEL